DKLPVLLRHPLLQTVIKAARSVRLLRKVRARQFDRPRKVTLKGPDEQVVRRHLPVRAPPGIDVADFAEQSRQKIVFYISEIFRPADFIGVAKVAARLPFTNPPVKQRLVLLIAVPE